MERTYLKALAIMSLIIAIWFFLSNSLLIGMTLIARECDRIKVTETNRNKILSALEEFDDVDFRIEELDMKQVKEVERHVGWHDMEITIFYLDGTKHSFYTRDSSTLLYQLIESEGYNVYLRSMEFVIDLIKAIVPLILIIGLSLFISKLSCYNGDVEGRDYI